jgi:transcriptional regulator with XRE-family HTH domain
MTQKGLSEKIKIPDMTISNLIKDKKEPGALRLAKIAEALEVDLHWLITGQGFDD